MREERTDVAVPGLGENDALHRELDLLRRERECMQREQELLKKELELLRSSPAAIVTANNDVAWCCSGNKGTVTRI
jgi:hypothetical protein